MKVRITLMTENDKHSDISTEEIEKKARAGWEIFGNFVTLHSSDPSEKITVENVEVIEQ